MSIGNAEIRKNIIRLVRKSSSTDNESGGLPKLDLYPEYRIRFLECRRRFEQLPPTEDKKPFLPDWINPENDGDLIITYKKKGNEITDLRINLLEDERVKHPSDVYMNRAISSRHTEFLRINEERSSCKSSKDSAVPDHDEIINFPRKNLNMFTGHMISSKRVVRPIFRKPIKLKKYDHIVATIANKK